MMFQVVLDDSIGVAISCYWPLKFIRSSAEDPSTLTYSKPPDLKARSTPISRYGMDGATFPSHDDRG